MFSSSKLALRYAITTRWEWENLIGRYKMHTHRCAHSRWLLQRFFWMSHKPTDLTIVTVPSNCISQSAVMNCETAICTIYNVYCTIVQCRYITTYCINSQSDMHTQKCWEIWNNFFSSSLFLFEQPFCVTKKLATAAAQQKKIYSRYH